MSRLLRVGPLPLTLWLAVGLMTACGDSAPPAEPAETPLSSELVFYGYPEDTPRAIFDAFTREYGVTIRYVSYDAPEESEAYIQAGQVYDVALIENQLISPLAGAGLLAEIDFANIPNFKNISANFRDLAIDPGNRYSIPCSYGTTGLVVRTDLVGDALSRFADLWDPQYAGKIGLRAAPREIIGMTLSSLGYPFSAEDPPALDAVRKRLLELKPSVVMVDIEASVGCPSW